MLRVLQRGTGMIFDTLPVSEVQNYWNARPCNIRHSSKERGIPDYFNEVEARKYKVEPHIKGFADFEKWRGKKVLEIGCGIGTDAINFARAGAQVTAVDLSDKSIEIAKQRAQVFGLEDRIRFVEADAERLTEFVAPEFFDLIYAFGVIHHTPRPELLMKQIRAYIKPSTTVKVMLYNRWSWKVLRILLYPGKGRFWELKQLIADNSEAQNGCPIAYVYSRKQGQELLRMAGLRTTEARVDHIFSFRVRDYVEYRYVRVWYFRWMPARLFRAFEKIIGWHLLLTAVPDSSPIPGETR